MIVNILLVYAVYVAIGIIFECVQMTFGYLYKDKTYSNIYMDKDRTYLDIIIVSHFWPIDVMNGLAFISKKIIRFLKGTLL